MLHYRHVVQYSFCFYIYDEYLLVDLGEEVGFVRFQELCKLRLEDEVKEAHALLVVIWNQLWDFDRDLIFRANDLVDFARESLRDEFNFLEMLSEFGVLGKEFQNLFLRGQLIFGRFFCCLNNLLGESICGGFSIGVDIESFEEAVSHCTLFSFFVV